MKYFGHQVNASQDIRLKRLRKACGSMGVDLYWRCLEIVGDKLSPKNTDCLLEHTYEELALEVDSTPQDVEKALNVMADLDMCHKVPLNATLCHFHFLKLIKYADKAFRNSYPGTALDTLYATMCHNVPLKKLKEQNIKEKDFKEKHEVNGSLNESVGHGQRLSKNELLKQAEAIGQHLKANDSTPNTPANDTNDEF